MKEYRVFPFSTGCFTGNLNPKKLEDTINNFASEGWNFERSIHETKSTGLVFKRETHFLIFSRDK